MYEQATSPGIFLQPHWNEAMSGVQDMDCNKRAVYKRSSILDLALSLSECNLEMLIFLQYSHSTRPPCNCRNRHEKGVNETNSVASYFLCHQGENGVMEMPLRLHTHTLGLFFSIAEPPRDEKL